MADDLADENQRNKKRGIVWHVPGGGKSHTLAALVASLASEDDLTDLGDETLEGLAQRLTTLIETASERPADRHDVAPALSYRHVPDLVRQRAKIYDELKRRARDAEISELKEAVAEKVDDPDAREQLTNKVSEIAQRQEELTAKFQASEDEYDGAKRKLEIRRETWEYRKSLLQREPVAVLVGAVLLSLLTGALILAMFKHVEVSDVVKSGFLLILGFFFGQTAGGKRGDN